MEQENVEQEIQLQPEWAVISPVTSVNGQTGDVVLTTSDLENTSNYQTGSDVTSAISAHNQDEEAHPYIQGQIETKQDQLTAGTNIQISEQNVISATDTTYSAGNGINISGQNAISVDTTIVATQQNLSDEVTNRENADIYLQQQIDGISASSDVVDIVGTYAELQQYDTQHLKDNDIIKVLQDETQGGATTYYRWSTHTSTFTLIGQEGPYYTKASADAQFVPQTRTVNSKALSSNIVLTASDVSALGTSDVVQTTGSSTSQVMSQNAVTTQLNTKLNVSDYVVDAQLANTTNPVQNQVLNGLLGDMPSDFFSGSATSNPTASTEIQVTNALAIDDYELQGNTTQQTYSGKNLIDNYDITYDYSNVGNQYTTLTTISTGIRYANTFDRQVPTVMFKLFDMTPYIGKTIRMSATFGTKGGIRLSKVNSDLSSRETIASSTVSGSTISYTVPSDLGTTIYLAYGLYIDGATGNETIDFTDLILTIDNADMSWEPFVGGTASPNPDYPQNVNVVTGEQNVWVHGNNLIDNSDTIYDYSTVSDSYNTVTTIDTGLKLRCTRSSGFVRIEFNSIDMTNYIGKTIRMKANFGSGGFIAFDSASLDGQTRQILVTNYTSGGILSYTVPSDLDNKPILRYCIGITGLDGDKTVDFTNLIMTIDNADMTYEPYQGANYTIDLDTTELCKIGTYQDYIYTDGTDWYVHKETGKLLLSSDTLLTTIYTVQGLHGIATITLSDKVAATAYSTAYCNCAYYVTRPSVGFDMPLFDGSFYENPSNFLFMGSANDTAQEIIDKFDGGALYYKLATPTNTKITDANLIAQLEAFKNASVYAGTTYFEVSASDLAGLLDLTVVNANANGIIYKIRGN